ncbi:heme-binding domain-containing protein [Ferruginibacter sp.]|nr:heme-binding domain-containing protein [Ferruginibacter sp.]
MKKFFKRFLLLLLLVFIVIQFFRPAKNKSEGISANDITKLYAVPQDVQNILKTSCYDCHSNNTAYPWYNNIQPVAWWLKDHVDEGKRGLNFSEFASYRIGKQYRKLEEINGEINDGKMPLASYTLIHGDAKLNEQQKSAVANWVTALRDSIKAQYPEDSLKRPQQPNAAPSK